MVMMKFSKHSTYLLALLSLLPAAAFAELKAGFVNAVKVMEAAPQVEKANARLEQEFAPRQRRIVTAQQEVRRLEEKLAKEETTSSDTESRNLSRDLMAKKRDLKREQDEFREDYNIRRNEELDKLQKRIVEVIQGLAKEEGYDFILSDGVVWASERVDITDKVLRRLTQK
jgi:outer membrane protein